MGSGNVCIVADRRLEVAHMWGIEQEVQPYLGY